MSLVENTAEPLRFGIYFNNVYSHWTPEVTTRLKELYDAGMSTANIANRLNEEFGTVFTRNAIIGKTSRERETYPSRRPTTCIKPHRTHVYRFHAPRPTQAIIDAAIPVEQRLAFPQLTSKTCHWPVGDPDEQDFFFCGGPVEAGKPYCSGHCAVAYRPHNREKQSQWQKGLRYYLR